MLFSLVNQSEDVKKDEISQLYLNIHAYFFKTFPELVYYQNMEMTEECKCDFEKGLSALFFMPHFYHQPSYTTTYDQKDNKNEKLHLRVCRKSFALFAFVMCISVSL